jgi:uncharacterized protein (UPF0332 family)
VSNLENKSELNIQAAKKLIEENLYAPSVHCSYYSCFQLLKFKMNDFFGLSYEQLGANTSSSPKGTHGYIIDYVKNQLRNNIDRDSSLNFSRQIKDLKLYREKSDYEDIEIRKEDSDKAYRTAENLLKFIKETF